MYEIINNVLKDELKYDGMVILKYEINYPEIKFNKCEFGISIFNDRNKADALKLEKYAKGELFEDAKKTYEYNKNNNYPIMVYELIKQYEITENNALFISLYSDEYTFTGGAHGNTIRTSQNFNVQIGREIPLQYFYPNDENYVIKILQSINKQIKEQIENGTNQYFDNYCELLLQTINLNSYFVKNSKVNIYFQQYDIAPYSSGIPVFEIEKS